MISLAAILLAGAAFAADAPPPDNIRAVPRTFLESLIVKDRPYSLKLKIYNTGVLRTKGKTVSSLKNDAAKVISDVPAFVLYHSTYGPVVFDAGLDATIAQEMNPHWPFSSFAEYESAVGRELPARLGRDAGKVQWVILSSLDRDHAGLAYQFHGATTVVSMIEWAARRNEQAQKKSARWVDPVEEQKRLTLKLVDFSTGAAPFGAFDHTIDFFGDGSILLLDLSGYSPGNMGVWANLDGGPVILAGDAVWVIDNLMDVALPDKNQIFNVSEYVRKIYMLRAMQDAAPRLVIFPGHDLASRTLTNRTDLPLVP